MRLCAIGSLLCLAGVVGCRACDGAGGSGASASAPPRAFAPLAPATSEAKVTSVMPEPGVREQAPPSSDWHVPFPRPGHQGAEDVADVSFLNRDHGPAGSHGRVRRDGERLVFGDGTQARLWGTNLTSYALFGGSDADIVRLAQHISALGFNLVRLHHHDSAWVTPNVFQPGDSTRHIDDASFESLGRRVKIFAEHGIYTWIDIEVGRKYRPGDRISGFSEIDASDSRGFGYVNADLEKAWREFARQYLSRKNPHNGLSFAEDPAVVAVLLTNENDLTGHFGHKMLPDKPTPLHTALLRARAEEFAAKTSLPRDQLLRTWEPGPSKLLLADLEHAWFRRSRSLLAELGVGALVATTSTWGDNPLSSLPSLTAGDVIDVHAYGEEGFLEVDPRVKANFATWIASAQVAGFPLAVTEWNVPHPARDRFAAPLYVASLGALQGWDMVMHYAYRQSGIGSTPRDVDPWSSVDDPALTTQMPAAALLFRRGDVAQAKRTVRLEPGRALYDEHLTPVTSAALRTTFEQSRLVIGLPDVPELSWDTLPKTRADRTVVEPGLSLLAADATQVVSDTGELLRSWSGGYQLIDTPRTQAATGWLGGRSVELRDVTIELSTAKAAVAVSSLDGQPIATSGKLLVSVTAQASASGRLPFRAEPVLGRLLLRTECRCARAVGAASSSPRPLAHAEDASGRSVTVSLGAQESAHWFVLSRSSDDAEARCE